MRQIFSVLACLLASLNAVADSRESVDIHRTAHGVVHVDAQSEYGAAYGLAYAYATDNVCLLADYVVTVNGERSLFFDPTARTTVGLTEVQNLSSDRFFRYYLDDEALAAAYATIEPQVRALLRGYVAGFNAYLRDTPGSQWPVACRNAPWVRPLTERDMYRMLEERAILSSGSALLEGIVGATPPDGKPASAQTPRSAATDATLGSNGWAFGADVTSHGGGLVMANPHFPWESINRMYQVHLRVAGQYDVMGATLPPYPAVTIGFNRDVAWTHTVSTAQRYTLFELRLAADDPKAYYFDGRRLRMVERTVTVPVRGPNGSTHQDRHVFFETIHGPIVSAPGMGFAWTRERAYAIQDVNRLNVDSLAVWRDIARAKSVTDVRNALARKRAVSWVNTIAADRDGNTLFADISRVPNVSQSLFEKCRVASRAASIPVVLDGSRAECRWYVSKGDGATLPVAQLPVTQRRDYVANSNDSYWLVNASAPRASLSPILGPTAIPQRLRTRIGLLEIERQVARGRGSVDSAALEAMLFSNRNHSAELFADDVIALCSQDPGRTLPESKRADIGAACAALRRWDRRNDLDSRGAALFREFWLRAKDIESVYAIAFDASDPIRTPRGLNWREPAVREKLLTALADAAALLRRNGFPSDARLGDIQAVTRNDRRIEIHGGAWYDGVLNLNLTRELTPAGYVPYDGASYIQIVALGREGPTAHGLLAYGQSTNPQSPYFSDQTELYSRKQLYRLPYTQQEIRSDPAHQVRRLPVVHEDGRSSAAETRATWPPQFESYVAQLMQDWSIPGAAVAVVRREAPEPEILSFGLRQWNRSERVDGRTMFGIASITKTFVAAGIGLLVQAGKLQWDDPVVRHLPDFKVRDPWISREVTLRDLLAHRSGVASYGDFLEEVPGLSEAQLVARLALHEQSSAFRAGAEYNNYAYVVLAAVIERVSGQPWGDFLRDRLWRPLGMHDTYAHADDFVPAQNVLPSGDGWLREVPLGLAAVPEQVNVAAPHVRPEAFYRGAYTYDSNENNNTLAHFHRTAIDPSQSVFASIADMSRWARVLLEQGEGQPAVLSKDVVRAMRGLTSVRRKDWPLNWQQIDDDPRSGLRQVGFGLGLEIYSYRGRPLFGHSGGELGYNALMVIDPTAGFAVIALVNNAWRTWGSEHALVQTVLDWQYGSNDVDWSRHYLDRGAREHAKNLATIEELLSARPPGKRTLADIGAYAGTYTNPLFGTLHVSSRGGKLYATTGRSWEIELDHWGQDQFRGSVISPLRLGAFARFGVTAQRSVDSIELEFVELWGTRFRFERARPRRPR